MHTRSPKMAGRVELFTFDGNNRIIQSVRAANTVQYEGYDALGQIMSGQLDASINAMYFQFERTGSGALQDVSGRDVDSADFRALTGNRDFVRSQLTPGALSGTAAYSQYSSNQATFSGIAALSDVGAAQGLTMIAGSDIERCALVIAPSWSDKSQDLVYAAWAPTSLITVPASGGVGLRWTIIFAHTWS